MLLWHISLSRKTSENECLGRLKVRFEQMYTSVYQHNTTQHNTDRELRYTIGWLTTKKVEIQHPLHRTLLVIVEQGLCCAREQLPRRHCVRPRGWPQISVPYHTISHETSTNSLHCLLHSATPLLLFPCPPPVTCVESSCSKVPSHDGSDLPNVRIQRKSFGVQRPPHRRPCHKIRLNPTPKTSGNQFRNPTRNPICTQQSQNKPKTDFSDFSEPERYLRSWNLKLASISFPLSKKQKPTQAGQKQKKDSQVRLVSPQKGKKMLQRERERERERERDGGDECNRGNGWERNVISDGENERTWR